MDPKANFDVFIEKLSNYVIWTFKNPGEVVAIVRTMYNTRGTFNNKNMPKDLTEQKENSKVQKEFKRKGLRRLLLEKWIWNTIFNAFMVLSGDSVNTLYNTSFEMKNTTIKSQLILIAFGSWRI